MPGQWLRDRSEHSAGRRMDCREGIGACKSNAESIPGDVEHLRPRYFGFPAIPAIPHPRARTPLRGRLLVIPYGEIHRLVYFGRGALVYFGRGPYLFCQGTHYLLDQWSLLVGVPIVRGVLFGKSSSVLASPRRRQTLTRAGNGEPLSRSWPT